MIKSDPVKWWARIINGDLHMAHDSAVFAAQRISGFQPLTPNGRTNAFQHAIWVGMMNSLWGPEDAYAWSVAHEILDDPLTPQQERERDMDFHNNRVGLLWRSTLGTPMEWAVAQQSQLCWLEGPGASPQCPP